MDLRGVFASNLRRLRREKGITQEELAFRAEIDRSYVALLERGDKYYASLKVIGKVAEALDTEPAELLQLPRKRARR